MNQKQSTSWEQLAPEFLNDRRMLRCHCSLGAMEMMMELGSCVTGEAEHVYFLTHRDALAALSALDQDSDCCCAWLDGLCMLVAWRLGYPRPARQQLPSALFWYPMLGIDLYGLPEKIGGTHYHLNHLKAEQKKALMQADLAKLRLFVDLAREPKKKLKQLLMLAIKEKIHAAVKELISWLPEYPDSLDSQALVTLLLNCLPNETQASFLTKLQHLEQHPLLKQLVNAPKFRTHWFMHLMSAQLMNARILTKMLALGLPADNAINTGNKWCHDDSLLECAADNTPLPRLPDVMRVFRELKPLVTTPILEQLEKKKGNRDDARQFKLILLFCDLADAFAEWEGEKTPDVKD